MPERLRRFPQITGECYVIDHPNACNSGRGGFEGMSSMFHEDIGIHVFLFSQKKEILKKKKKMFNKLKIMYCKVIKVQQT